MVFGPLLGENAGSDSAAGDVWVAKGLAYRISMLPGRPRVSGGESTSSPKMCTFHRYFDFGRNCRFEQRAILAAGIFYRCT